MPFIKVFSLKRVVGVWVFLSLVLGAATSVLASEAPAEGEAAEGGGGPNNTEFVEYSKRLNKMTQLQTKVAEGTAGLQDLIRQKNNGVTEIKDDKNNRESILKLIVTRHKELIENYSLYNEELRALTYRFPSKGEEISRKYIPLRPKSLEQVEREMGLQGDLTALKNKVDTKYKVFAPPAEVVPAPKSKGASPNPNSNSSAKPERLKLVK